MGGGDIRGDHFGPAWPVFGPRFGQIFPAHGRARPGLTRIFFGFGQVKNDFLVYFCHGPFGPQKPVNLGPK